MPDGFCGTGALGVPVPAVIAMEWATERGAKIMDLEILGRAYAGALYLDQIEPGWRDRVDPKTLDMANGRACILGQTFGRRVDNGDGYLWARVLSQGPVVPTREVSERLGFTVPAFVFEQEPFTAAATQYLRDLGAAWRLVLAS